MGLLRGRGRDVLDGAGRVLLALNAVWAPLGAFRFDWNETHVFNPAWPPHAKFHNAQTMSLAVGLAALAVWKVRPGAPRPQEAAAVASLYWLTQLSSVMFPGTALQDPGQPPPPRLGPVPVDQRFVALVGLATAGLGAVALRKADR